MEYVVNKLKCVFSFNACSVFKCTELVSSLDNVLVTKFIFFRRIDVCVPGDYEGILDGQLIKAFKTCYFQQNLD